MKLRLWSYMLWRHRVRPPGVGNSTHDTRGALRDVVATVERREVLWLARSRARCGELTRLPGVRPATTTATTIVSTSACR